MIDARPLARDSSARTEKISKVGAGYVYEPKADYRCRECWKFLEDAQRCAEISGDTPIRPNGYCTLWSKGKTAVVTVIGRYRAEQVGYGEARNGTTCGRCKHFDGASRCEIVEGVVAPGGCCNNQEPK